MKHLFCAAGLLCCYALHAQTTVSVNAERDNTIYSESGATSNGAGAYFFAGVNASGSIRRSLIRFDVSGIPPGAVVTSVTLKIFCSKAASGPGRLAVHRLNKAWGEGASDAGGEEGGGAPAQPNDATWTVPFFGQSGTWDAPGGDFVGTPSASVGQVALGNNLEITSSGLLQDVQGWINNPASNFGWALLGGEDAERSSRRYNSRNNSQNAPVLTITYTGTLPVKLLSFRAVPEKTWMRLEWKAAEENNFRQFELECSPDAITFQKVVIIPANESGTYNGYHLSPQQGKNYYRLRMIDRDGSATLSKTIIGIFQMQGSAPVFPNHATNQIRITLPQGIVEAQYTIFDYSGRVVQSGAFTGGLVQVGSLVAGTYYLKLNTPGEEMPIMRFMRL